MKTLKDISTGLFSVVALACMCASQMGVVVWHISTPDSGSSRHKGANVAATGTIDQTGQGSAVFKFGKLNSNSPPGFDMENEMTVTADDHEGTATWGGTLAPPSGSTWSVSPKDSMGMYVGVHVAKIIYPGGERNTALHVVRNE